MNIGEAIKKERKKKKLTQKELALKIDKSERMVQKYENGEVIPSFKILKEIGNILDAPVEAFLSSEAIALRKEDEAMQGLSSLLELLYDEVDWKPINGGDPNYDGDYNVYLTRGEDEICLSKRQYDVLFNFVITNIPNYIEVILSHEE